MATPQIDPLVVATRWIESLSEAAAKADVTSFVDHFLPTGWMRDLLCFSWDFRSLAGHEKLAAYLSERVGDQDQTRLARAGLHNIRVQTTSTLGPPTFFPIPSNPDARGIQGTFEFSLTSPAAVGRGFLRLVPDPNGQWKAFAIFMNLEDLKGHEEPRGRPLGLYPNHATWEEVYAQKVVEVEQDPTVVIVGGGQTGLMCAARLGRLGIRALVVEKSGRVGDVWRKRYPNLTLHTSAHHCSVLYQPWPKTFPKYVPKEKVADFIEAYAIGQEVVIWTLSTVLPIPTYDAATGRWSITIDRQGEKVSLKPKHVIMATGTGKPYTPAFKDVDKFKGVLYHSDQHRGAAPYRGKRVVVVGSCNAGHDLCIDFFAKGAESVTMVQRSPTCVMAASTADRIIFDVIFNEKFAIEDADFSNHSMPHALALKLAAAGGTQRVKALDKGMLDGLAKAGFKLTWELTPGGGEVGLQGFFFERTASGTMLDQGCAQLIIDGKVKVKNGEIARFEEDGVVFNDGTKTLADVVVLGTGYLPVINNIVEIFGPSITDKIGSKIWGLDEEGELNRCFRPSGQQGLWVAMGSFQHGRFFSKHLALQILAEELQLK
ncbi:FAD/NAD(P)-binding domain-containing protein [Laetiporus sulphureus 93-53]|uniref:FAD/NAD(P)-binding domain-containing protein n=1 Tax=Laetiporus sulphureus 93-53 TaxID=1314785 RepID=A0A165CNG9_9APHY|nr:FAD/NAD(P)-binding domain-containing protein [Laetiporus sulphureus 93-53]KZT03130.1 FAD/NAD(P)-binding domain-containing protein [Laetiporus sulphureus 93-53]